MSSTQLWSPNSTANNKVDDDGKSIADEETLHMHHEKIDDLEASLIGYEVKETSDEAEETMTWHTMSTFSDILKVNGGIQELQLNSSEIHLCGYVIELNVVGKVIYRYCPPTVIYTLTLHHHKSVRKSVHFCQSCLQLIATRGPAAVARALSPRNIVKVIPPPPMTGANAPSPLVIGN
ncbi:hypothetical protein ZIOFF_044833 [Zingiber officinale]|uniref:Uncharacterized protein n=1 Tax=Zingiber officinale TaxID=94328 RepID=A0A8J5FXI2_ZINOF|nr:hypothetical protein ZIOFF_044833 [Zingiber officinale]